MIARKEPPRAAQLAALLAKLCPNATHYRVALAVQAMTAAAKAHKAVGVARCNYPHTEAQEARQDKRLNRLELDAAQQLSECGKPTNRITLEFGGDPRGSCGRMIVDGMGGDGWGDGFAIYDEGGAS